MSNKTKIPIPKGWRRVRPGAQEKLMDRFRHMEDGGHPSIGKWHEMNTKTILCETSFPHWIVIRRLAPRKGRGK